VTLSLLSKSLFEQARVEDHGKCAGCNLWESAMLFLFEEASRTLNHVVVCMQSWWERKDSIRHILIRSSKMHCRCPNHRAAVWEEGVGV
jgi:hypothetical protein